MATTYEPIATTTLGSAAASVTFSSISGSFTDLVLVAEGYNATGDFYGVSLRFNSDSGSNYSRTNLYGDGTNAASNRASNATSAYVNPASGWTTTSSNRAMFIVHIMSYSNTTTYKTLLARAGLATNALDANVNLWRNTAAITSLEVLVPSGTFASTSTFTLYGIKAA